MSLSDLRSSAALLLSVLAAAPSAAGTLDRYRDYTLGASTTAILAATQAPAQDLKTRHTQPALLQELSWRPGRVGAGGANLSIAVITFNFLNDALFRIEVEYNRASTEGLSHSDMTAAISAMYGVPAVVPTATTRRTGRESLNAVRDIATWHEGNTSVFLRTSDFSGTFGLVVTALAEDAVARKAQAEAVLMDERSAPLREAARVKAAAAAATAAEKSTREKNKATFRP